MALHIAVTCEGIDWERVAEVIKLGGLGDRTAVERRRMFEAGRIVAFAFEDELLVGTGRAISDGVCQAAVYDVVVHPDYQGRGIGRAIMESVIDQLGECNVILFAVPEKIGFYEKLGFGRMTTAMARFQDPETWRERGYIER